jgi:hypothetical protein
MRYNCGQVDLVTGTLKPFSATTPLRDSFCSRKNSGKQRNASLFFRSPNRRRPRISAGNAISVAADFLQKQREQRFTPVVADDPAASPDPAVRLVLDRHGAPIALVCASEI